MSPSWWIAIGAVAAGPVWVAATIWVTRRIWRITRRMAARTRGREQLAELGHLAGGLAHEIKNPLSTINVNLQLLAEDLERLPSEEHQRWLRRLNHVRDEVQRVKGILDDFLQYARRYDLTLDLVDLRRLVEELIDFFGPQAEANKVLLRSALPEEAVRCRIDTDLLKQAVLNLMLNAVQAMPGGGELLIRLAARRGQAELEIIDTGTGIDAAGMEKIFQVYYSTKKGGSGLGLPTTRRIVHEHGGMIQAESEPGKGTRFTIRLPIVKG